MTPLPLCATLRLQFHRDFTFDDTVPLLPYFRRLGITHLYASPLLASTPGSMHGYDTVDCHRIDPERGGEDGLRRLVAALRENGMGLILDIVPNHMGVGPANGWWMDVLSKGRQSPFARHFDIDWSPDDPGLQDKVILPFLGAPLADLLQENAIRLIRNRDSGALELRYGDHVFPLSEASRADIDAQLGQEADAATLSAHYDTTDKKGRARFLALLDAQHYRLVWWRVAGDLVNWRRFFDVTSLVALRMDRRDVFEDAHKLVFDLYRDGLIDGIRVDHIDGLARPAEYCTRLRARLTALARERPEGLRQEAPFFIEKILEGDEILPLEWPVTGTTGYDFLDQVDLLFHHPDGETPLTELWAGLSPDCFETEKRRAREEKLETAFYNAFHTLSARICSVFPREQDLTAHACATALGALLRVFPVYRSYFADGGDSGADFRAIDRGRRAASPLLSPALRGVLDRICQYLADARIDTAERQDILERFEHLTAPLTAKAGEDTAFYRYARLLSRNDVGCDPAVFSASVGHFHEKNRARLTSHPDAMLTTATHDHKRGEDGRARLAVLSEPAADWPETARRWIAGSAEYPASPTNGGGLGARPVPADIYFILQTLVSAWPLLPADRASLPDRLDAYLTKALREAGLRTSWADPDETYEAACLALARGLCAGAMGEDIARYVERIGAAAALNGLSQTLLRFTSPGVPDLYQGRENWDFSLVDPDNRRPVDYAACESMLRAGSSFAESGADWKNGRIKQALIQTVLALRADDPALFSRGDYRAIEVSGPLGAHLVAFRRDLEGRSCVVVAPRLMMALAPDEALRTRHEGWHDTALPCDGAWRSLLHPVATDEGTRLSLSHLDGRIPLDILVRKP